MLPLGVTLEHFLRYNLSIKLPFRSIDGKNRGKTGGIKVLRDTSGKWQCREWSHRHRHTNPGEQIQQPLTLHFHFYGLLPSAEGLQRFYDTQQIKDWMLLVFLIPQSHRQAYITGPLLSPLQHYCHCSSRQSRQKVGLNRVKGKGYKRI